MKLSRTSWLILTLGVLAITFGSLGATRSQQLNEGKKLSDELAIAQSRLSKLDLKDLYSQQQKLETQISETEAQLKAEQTMLSQPNDSIFVSDAVFHIAGISGVEVAEVTSGTLTSGDLSKVPCTILQFEVVARGDVSSLIDFVTRLNIDFPTGEVSMGEIVVPKATSAGSTSDNTTGTESYSTGDITSDNTTGLTGISTTGNVTADDRPSAHIRLLIYSYKGK